ncbi:MAG: sulfur carrier protein ThiS [Sedimentisphaerales bacterium]|nr:sulfur carrier protein ThiS [Sedimentisphaerales bacterium]
MEIRVNGTAREIAEGATVEQLLTELSLRGPLAVELNRQVCPRRRHAETELRPGDVVEIVTIVGGG